MCSRVATLVLLVLMTSMASFAAERPTAERPQTHPIAPGLESIEKRRLEADVTRLAGPDFSGRGSWDDRREVARLIAERFRSQGLSPLFVPHTDEPRVTPSPETPPDPLGEYLQLVPGPAAPGDERPISERPPYGWNVGAIIPGSDPDLAQEWIVVSAHFDHLGRRNGRVYPGADDNASGVAMLLELSRIWGSRERPRRSIALVAFDLEESLLWGSRWFAAHPPRPLESLKLFITADMIGRALGNLPIDDIFVLGAEHGERLPELLATVPKHPDLRVSRLGVDFIGTRSDYGPFRDADIPFLFFSSGEHPDYHSPRDTADRVDYEKVTRVTALVGEVAWRVAASEPDATPIFREPGDPEVVEVETLRHVCNQLLRHDELEKKAGRAGLSGLQRMLVTNTRNQAQSIIDRGKLTRGERGWLMRSAQLLIAMVL